MILYNNLTESIVCKGANVHAKDRNNETPLQLAVKHDFKEIIALLRQAGAYLEPTTRIADSATKYNLLTHFYIIVIYWCSEPQPKAISQDWNRYLWRGPT